jgi:hypothetical protein
MNIYQRRRMLNLNRNLRHHRRVAGIAPISASSPREFQDEFAALTRTEAADGVDRPNEELTFLERRRLVARGLYAPQATTARYNPGIQVRDLRRGEDFYPQEEVLGVPTGRGADEEPENAPSADDRVRQRYLEIFYRNNGGVREQAQREGEMPHDADELEENYLCLREKIPALWREEEIQREDVVKDASLLNYLENYGALALLIFLRS